MAWTFNSPSGSHRLLTAIALATVYFALAATSVLFTRFEGGTAFIWGASALLVGGLLASHRRFWAERSIACGVASFLATWLLSIGLVPGLALAFVNVGEVLVATALLCRAKPKFGEMQSSQEIGWIIAAAGVAAPLVSSVPGALVITAFTSVTLAQNWLAWLTGHSLGMFIFGPLAIMIARGRLTQLIREAGKTMIVPSVALLALLAVMSILVFSQEHLPLLFITIPFLVLNTFQLGRLGSIASLLLLFVFATAFSVQGMGPIGSLAVLPSEKALLLQLYLASASLTVLPISADLQAKKSLFVEARNQASLYRLVLESSSDLIVECDLEGRTRFASASAKSILGLEPGTLVGNQLLDLVHSDDRARVRRVHRKLASSASHETIVSEFRTRQPDQRWTWFESHARRVFEDQGRDGGIVAVIRDITRRKHAELGLKAAANTDPLTGLANRRGFDTAVEELTRFSPRRPPSTLALFDIDHFKAINDEHGHATGDEVLKVFASLLRDEIRETDIACRFGGEEFAVLLEGGLDSGRAVCDRIRQRFASRAWPGNGKRYFRASVSAGVVALPPTGRVHEFLLACDDALYRAKNTGRNRVCSS